MLILAFPAEEVALGKRQEYAVYSRIVRGSVQKFGLDAGRGNIVDDEPAAGHQARYYKFIDLSVVLRRFDVGKAKCQRVGSIPPHSTAQFALLVDFSQDLYPGIKNFDLNRSVGSLACSTKVSDVRFSQ